MLLDQGEHLDRRSIGGSEQLTWVLLEIVLAKGKEISGSELVRA